MMDWPTALRLTACLTFWATMLVCCYFAWPVIRCRRWRITAAAALCLTPVILPYVFLIAYLPSPLIMVLPAYVSWIPFRSGLLLEIFFLNWKILWGPIIGLVIIVLAYWLSRFLVQPDRVTQQKTAQILPFLLFLLVFSVLSPWLAGSMALTTQDGCTIDTFYYPDGKLSTEKVEEVLLNTASLTMSLLYACLVWPIIQRRRSYMIAIAILCLTPVSIGYFSDICRSWVSHWPLLMSLPVVIVSLPESLDDLLYVSLPIGTGIGILAYWLSGFLVKRNPDRNSAKKS